MIVATASGRCGIVGNPTDGYGGVVVSCSLAERATTRLTESDHPTVTIGDATTELPDRDSLRLATDELGDRFNCVRAVLRFLKRDRLPVSVDVQTKVPIRAGLAGSTAVLTSIVAAFREYLQLPPISPHMLAETVRTIELHFLEIQCGYQDQYMTVFGGLNYIDFRAKELYRNLEDELFATVESLNPYIETPLPLVLANTGKKRVSGKVLKPIRERYQAGDRDVVEGYQRITMLGQLGKRAVIEGDWGSLGELMNENHSIQRQLGASSDINDQFINVALQHGAVGSKLAGAGGGGTIIALTFDPDRTIAGLKAAGAANILRPEPAPGVEVFRE